MSGGFGLEYAVGGLDVLHHGVSAKLWPASMTMFIRACLLVAELAGTRMRWLVLRRIGMALPPVLLIAALAKAHVSHNPLSDLGIAAWLLGFATAFFLIHRQERDGIVAGGRLAYTMNWLLLAGVATWEAAWLLSHRDYLDCLLLALLGHGAAYLCFELRERNAAQRDNVSDAVLLWSAFFWYVAAYGLTDKYLAGGERIAAMLGVVTMSVLAYVGVGSLLDWQALRRGMLVAWIVMPAAALWQLAHDVHPAQVGGWLAWPSLYVVSLWIFRQQERHRPVTGAAVMRGLT